MLLKHSKKLFFVLLTFISLIAGSLGAGAVITVTENDWTNILQGEWMVEFYAPWCPACRNLENVWKEFATWSDDLGIKVAQIDVTTNPGMSGRFMVTQLPTIYHVKDGIFRQYRGTRSKDAFLSFVDEKKWKEVEPISSWKSPQSMQMSVISSLFKASMVAKSVHNYLVNDLGLPPAASYALFGLATIVVGCLLGVVLVYIMDFFYPSPAITEESFLKPKARIDDKVVESSEKEEEAPLLEEEKTDESTENDANIRRRALPTEK